MDALFQNHHRLMDHIRDRLQPLSTAFFPGRDKENDKMAAAVLFLLGMHRPEGVRSPEPSLIFNQRSDLVRQPGDLCFTGGGLSPRLDRLLSAFLRLPGLPLHGWNSNNRRRIPGGMARFLATSLREGFEEMRLNPFHIKFLGPMAPEHFKRLNRMVYPMVAWHTGPHSFSPNWEVERIVYIPLRRFFVPGAYARFPLPQLSRFDAGAEFPCLVYENGDGREILWGLTFRIVMRFLEIVFDFKPPETAALPLLQTH